MGPTCQPPPGARCPRTWPVQGSGPRSPSGRGGRPLELANRAEVLYQWGAAHVGPSPGGQTRWVGDFAEGTPTPVCASPPVMPEDRHAGAQGRSFTWGKAQHAPRTYFGADPTHEAPTDPRQEVARCEPPTLAPITCTPQVLRAGASCGLWSGPPRRPTAVVSAGARGTRAPRPSAAIRALRQPKARPRAARRYCSRTPKASPRARTASPAMPASMSVESQLISRTLAEPAIP